MDRLILILFIQLLCCWTQSYGQSATGDIKGPFSWKSKIYPGTERNYWVYVPKQYDAAKPACLMVVQDGLARAKGWNLPSILDSLIAERKIPVLIGIFIDPGIVPAAIGSNNYPRYNRSLEYDAMGDRYSRFLLEELIPEVERSYAISKDPNDRSIGGASSGAICAFNVAWERPDQFRRVLSTIGTYVGLRGGDGFATLVRKTEAKPLRIFLQDGTKDLNIYAGDWWMANQDMLSALHYAGYEVNHAWGEGGGHDSKHTQTILPAALTWLWKDYPAPVQTHKGMNQRINLLLEGEAWREIQLTGMGTTADKLAINGMGEVFFSDKQFIYKIDSSDKPTLFASLKGKVGGISFHADGKLYATDVVQHKILAINEHGILNEVAKNIDADFLAISDKAIYFTETTRSRIGIYRFSSKQIHYVDVPFHPTGIAISAEQTFLNAGASDDVFGHSFKIMADGGLDFGQAYIHYHIPYGKTTGSTGGLTVDSENLLYSATDLGVQVSDQLGRVNFIFSQPAKITTDVKLGGVELNTLYSSSSGRIFKRKIKAKGVLSWLPPVKPPQPGL
jgi:gluconolactonase